MKANQPDWERALSHSPTSSHGFSPKLMKQIEEKAAMSTLSTMKNKSTFYRWSSSIGIVMIAIIILFTAQQRDWFQLKSNDPNPIDSHLTGDEPEQEIDVDSDPDGNPESDPSDVEPSSNYFDPYEIKVGDQVVGWTVSSIQNNYFDVPEGNTVMTSFTGEVEISGSFEYVNDHDDEPYNRNEVIFILDEASTARVPVPIAYAPQRTTRIVVTFDREEDKATFGPPGTTGVASIVISDYETLMAEAYGGIIDNAKFKHRSVTTREMVVESYIEMLGNNDVLSILRILPADSIGLDLADYGLPIMTLEEAEEKGLLNLPPFVKSDAQLYDQIYAQHDAVKASFGEDAWEHVTYTFEEVDPPDGRTGFIEKSSGQEISQSEYEALNQMYWENIAKDNDITYDQLFSFVDPDLDSDLPFQTLYVDHLDDMPTAMQNFYSYDMYKINLAFHNETVGKDGAGNFHINISNQTGEWRVREGLRWDLDVHVNRVQTGY